MKTKFIVVALFAVTFGFVFGWFAHHYSHKNVKMLSRFTQERSLAHEIVSPADNLKGNVESLLTDKINWYNCIVKIVRLEDAIGNRPQDWFIEGYVSASGEDATQVTLKLSEQYKNYVVKHIVNPRRGKIYCSKETLSFSEWIKD